MNKEQEKPDNVADNPATLPYPHHVGSTVIKPLDKGRVKGRALSAMEAQTDMQMQQIKEQIELLAAQAQAIQDRRTISEKIYQAEVNFEPLIGHTYHLYERESGSWILSMIGPEDWGRSMKYRSFVATVLLLADHTWDILVKSEDSEIIDP